MKRYIISSSDISNATLQQAIKLVKCFKHTDYDLDNHCIVVPLTPGIEESDLMQEGMLGKWFTDNGFDISFDTGDFEYTTKGTFNSRSMTKEGAGNKRYLRNRLIMTITW